MGGPLWRFRKLSLACVYEAFTPSPFEDWAGVRATQVWLDQPARHDWPLVHPNYLAANSSFFVGWPIVVTSKVAPSRRPVTLALADMNFKTWSLSPCSL